LGFISGILVTSFQYLEFVFSERFVLYCFQKITYVRYLDREVVVQ